MTVSQAMSCGIHIPTVSQYISPDDDADREWPVVDFGGSETSSPRLPTLVKRMWITLSDPNGDTTATRHQVPLMLAWVSRLGLFNVCGRRLRAGYDNSQECVRGKSLCVV